eukprot:6058591-Pleurochrysis_carterae.AAC.1
MDRSNVHKVCRRRLVEKIIRNLCLVPFKHSSRLRHVAKCELRASSSDKWYFLRRFLETPLFDHADVVAALCAASIHRDKHVARREIAFPDRQVRSGRGDLALCAVVPRRRQLARSRNEQVDPSAARLQIQP